MNRVVIAIVFFTIILITIIGCSGRTDSFSGPIQAVQENSFTVNCSNEINKGKKNVNSIGYTCTVTYTNDTTFQDENGNRLAVDSFLPGSEVKVILPKPINFKKYYDKPLSAKQIILVKGIDPVKPYDFRRDEVLRATIYRGGNDQDGSDNIIVEIQESDKLNQLSAILHHSPHFTGNATSDWNYTIVIISKDGSERIIEISGGVHVFTDRSHKEFYALDKEKLIEFIERYETP